MRFLEIETAGAANMPVLGNWLGAGMRWIGYSACAIALVCSGAAFAQPAPSAPSAPFEIVSDRVDYVVHADGSFTQTQESTTRILTQQALQILRQTEISYSEGYQSGDIVEAYTLKSDGTRIDVPRDKMLVTSGAGAGAMFSDYKSKIAVYQNVEVGDEVVSKISFTQNTPWFKNQFSLAAAFPRSVPVHNAIMTLTAPKSFPLQFDVSGLGSAAPEQLDDTQRWTWSYANNATGLPEAGSISDFDSGPHLVVSSYTSYAQVAQAYQDGAREKAAPTDDIRALADQLTVGVSDRREQAQRLYDWVSGNIKYVAIFLGKGGIVPHAASDVLHSRYGDCKDHVVLLEALLAAKGIPSTGALISIGNIYKLSPVPAFDLFNHIITYVPEFDMYLDSTVKTAPFGTLPAPDADKPVLLVSTGAVARTPNAAAAQSTVRTVTTLTIDRDGEATGDSEVSATGSAGAAFRALMDVVSPQVQANFVRATVPGASDGTVTKADTAKLVDPYVHSVHFNIPNAANFPGPGGISFGLGYHPVALGNALNIGLPVRQSDYTCGSFTATDDTTIHFPAGVRIISVPKSQTLTADGVSVSIAYTRSDPLTVRSVRTLTAEHPHAVCAASYYNRARPQLMTMAGALSAQVLYEKK